MDGIKVLMVDDEARMRKLVKDFLSIKGYKVIEAEDGEQAVDLFFNLRIRNAHPLQRAYKSFIIQHEPIS